MAVVRTVEVFIKCCCGCGRRADGPSFHSPYDATNRYRGGKSTHWAAECWQRNVEWCARMRAEQAAATAAAVARALHGSASA